MSRTYHHSRKFGKNHRLVDRPDHKHFGGKNSPECPNWYSHEYDIRPGRHRDKRVAKSIVRGGVSPEDAVFPYTGTKRPHEYYW
ncbi:hypothetical protein CSR02_12550 [Acetobacter pomorum]|uniref:Uncharacterized protein n=1 Tax=Acetobacter pomorum TaxID=65959 RepID=A0A2G4R9I0_9PROT|nr:hypothetical protein CSR02_12550 [Acetobacter pomorum]GBR52855.1 hypothetical protein AA11825_2354 [Acetobacter pomorum DSM 11825]